MLFLIPPALHRAALRHAHRLRKLWWGWRKPQLIGCRIMAVDAAGAVLLIRHSYGFSGWMLPGGGLKRGEDVLAAAARELAEETGCGLADARLVETLEHPLWGATNRVHFVAGHTLSVPRPDEREVVAARFFAIDALPDNIARGLGEQLVGWLAALEG